MKSHFATSQTLFFVCKAYRLSSCCFCYHIAVFDQGHIVQNGTREELVADANGKYYELWNAQAQYYTETA